MKTALVYLNRNPIASQGPGWIATVVRTAGHHVDFIDTAGVSQEEVLSRLVCGQYDLVMISVNTMFYAQMRELVSLFREKSTVRILVGGIHPSIIKGQLLKDCPEVDYICVGEGEEFTVKFLDDLSGGRDLGQISNLGYRQNGNVVLNSVGPPTDLTTLPSFDYGLFPSKAVVQQEPLPGFCYVYATRGCPYRCSYCCNSTYLDIYKKYYLRVRNPTDVIHEMIRLRDEYSAQFFYFGDEMILFDPEYALNLFQRVKVDVGCPYGIMTRVESIIPGIVKVLKKTGCRYAALGVECGDEEFRREFLNRRMTNGQIIEAFDLLHTIPKIHLTAFTMTRWPVSVSKNRQLDVATNKLIRRLKPTLCQQNIFFPFPGTRLYDYCIDRDLIDWDKMNDARNVSSISVLKGCHE